ncbi:MAG: M1 family peptidase [Acidobacteria bacterium]|nr:MAG: M1 family peptidase [Acidobacteriota bacterium]REJ98013.1 MAG: M1 family peptidase [Acidobacteriota bacterium]REK16756.1 MAG: M1 family peptidase [Acidobacteriota bacterium]REK42667.1 MAG: M1 family peptidase [Acidobacteriota bacterium]
MRIKIIAAVVLVQSLFLFAPDTAAQNTIRKSIDYPTRAIRRDVPLTDSIRRAMKAGTRNFSGRPGPNYWQLKTDYTINARLLPWTQTIHGSEKIVLHNNSPDDLEVIVLRLDHNIFRGLVPRGYSVPAENTDGMVITRITVDGREVDLAPQRIRTRDGEEPPKRLIAQSLDQTVGSISLDKPVPSKGRVTIEIDWSTKLPGGPNGQGHRMTQRWDDRLFQPTQWFPRIAKYDDLRGWNTDPYLGPAEFHNNFGRFDVKIDVPAGWLVTGTGVLQNPKEVYTPKALERLSKVLESDEEITIVGPDEVGPGKSTVDGDHLVWHFIAENVNDFAWATARDYVFKATRATIPGKGPVPIYMVHIPERERYFERAAELSRHALEFYSELWAPYPFPQLTLQDGPSAGMEYPMVINSNQGAADHEVAHQWWPMMVGTDERRYGWMDEGFNQYMNILSRAHREGEEPDLNGLGQRYGSISGNEIEAPMMWNANFAGPGYGFQTYGKTPLMLSMLGEVVGDKEVQKAMSEYTHTWAFKHPSPWDYMFFMDNALGQDLGWFWYYWLFTTEAVNGSIERVRTERGKTIVTVRQDGQMPSPVVLGVEFEASGPAIKKMPNAKMTGDTSAEVRWPVDVWFDGKKEFEAVLDFGGRKVSKVTFDPNRRFPDNEPNDNEWTASSTAAP